MGAVLTIAAEDLRTFVDDRFASGTDPQGDPWVPLEPPTIAKRRKGAGGGEPSILVDTSILRNSITSKIRGNRITVGTNIPYGLFHQFGTEAMFERPFIPTGADFEDGIGQAEIRSIERMITAWVVRGELG